MYVANVCRRRNWERLPVLRTEVMFPSVSIRGVKLRQYDEQ